jgi:hypothetical protein
MTNSLYGQPPSISGERVTGAQPPCDVDEAKVCNDGVAVLQKDVFCFKIFVNDAAVVEVAHALRDLLGDDDELVHRELVLSEVEVRIQSVA